MAQASRLPARFPRRSPLLPALHSDDFFVCDMFDGALKGDLAGMEFPMFSIHTRRDMSPIHSEIAGKYVTIQPSSEGRATVKDRDVLIYCISQLMKALNTGVIVGPNVRFKAYDMLRATNRSTSGQGYRDLKAALYRLRHTEISTDVDVGGYEEWETFGFIDHAKVVRETREGTMLDVEVTLSKWVFAAIERSKVLTLSPNYFLLRSPLDRRLYELARKFCGSKDEFRMDLDLLQARCGSQTDKYNFKSMIRKTVRNDTAVDHIPQYAIRLSGNQVIFVNRGEGEVAQELEVVSIPQLDPDVYEAAKDAAPGWDVHVIEAEWRAWAKEKPRNPELAFLGFCKTWAKKRGRP